MWVLEDNSLIGHNKDNSNVYKVGTIESKKSRQFVLKVPTLYTFELSLFCPMWDLSSNSETVIFSLFF